MVCMRSASSDCCSRAPTHRGCSHRCSRLHSRRRGCCAQVPPPRPRAHGCSASSFPERCLCRCRLQSRRSRFSMPVRPLPLWTPRPPAGLHSCLVRQPSHTYNGCWMRRRAERRATTHCCAMRARLCVSCGWSMPSMARGSSVASSLPTCGRSQSRSRSARWSRSHPLIAYPKRKKATAPVCHTLCPSLLPQMAPTLLVAWARPTLPMLPTMPTMPTTPTKSLLVHQTRRRPLAHMWASKRQRRPPPPLQSARPRRRPHRTQLSRWKSIRCVLLPWHWVATSMPPTQAATPGRAQPGARVVDC